MKYGKKIFIHRLQISLNWYVKVLGDALVNNGSHGQHIFSNEDYMIWTFTELNFWAPIIPNVVCYEL